MKKLVALVLAMAFVVAACSSSTEDAVSAYCEDLSELKTSIEALSALSASSTLDEINTAKDDVKSAYDATVASAGDVDEAVLSELDDAKKEWQSSVDAIPSDATVEEALVAVQAADAIFLASVKTTSEKVSCG